MDDRAPIRDDLSALEGDYEIGPELGRGATSVVYRARDRELGREVAIKVVRDSHLGDGEARARVDREARTLAEVQHPNIVTILAAKRLGDRGLALVMPLLRGQNLQDRIRESGPFPVEKAAWVLYEMGSALAYLHRRGIIHRDVKPENILMAEDGRVLLTDLGIAKRYDAAVNVTLDGVVVGTPRYMSPEQIDVARLDGRSDLYSLGLVGYEMLSGKQPWEGESIFSVMFKQKTQPLPPLEEARPGIPAQLTRVLERLLEKDRGKRYTTAEEFLMELGTMVPPAAGVLRPVSHAPAAPAVTAPLHAESPRAAREAPPPAEVSSPPTRIARTSELIPGLPLLARVDRQPAPSFGDPPPAAHEEFPARIRSQNPVIWKAAPRPMLASWRRLPVRPVMLAAAAILVTAGGAVFLPGLMSSEDDLSSAAALERTGLPLRSASGPPTEPGTAQAEKGGQDRAGARSPGRTSRPAAVPSQLERNRIYAHLEEAGDPTAIDPPAAAVVTGRRGSAPPPVVPIRSTVIEPPLSPAASGRGSIDPRPESPERLAARIRQAYPRGLAARQIGGTVVLNLDVDRRGRVVGSRVARSSGNAELDAAALGIGRGVRFIPATRDGVPVEGRIHLPLVFQPEERE